MSKFKVGDRVKKKDGKPFFSGALEVIVSRVVKGESPTDVLFQGTGSWSDEESLELVQEKEMTYKLETELTLQDIAQLRSFTGATSNMAALYDEVQDILLRADIPDVLLSKYWGEVGFLHTTFQKKCEEVVKKSKRKVVKVGDKEYYEDELSKALSNINAIGE